MLASSRRTCRRRIPLDPSSAFCIFSNYGNRFGRRKKYPGDYIFLAITKINAEINNPRPKRPIPILTYLAFSGARRALRPKSVMFLIVDETIPNISRVLTAATNCSNTNRTDGLLYRSTNPTTDPNSRSPPRNISPPKARTQRPHQGVENNQCHPFDEFSSEVISFPWYAMFARCKNHNDTHSP